jgi:diamine N-acetyltransferase
MSNEELKALLTRLHGELRSATGLDEESRRLLGVVVADIERMGLPHAAGFVILENIGDRHEGVKLKRVAVTAPGTGFGRALLAAVVDWVFENTRDERLWLDVFTYNERARHVYRRAGFVEDGLLRQAYVLPDGARADRVIMSMLRSEWAAR